MDKELISALIDKNPNLKRFSKKMESMVPGAYCMHHSWGFGQIQGYDSENNRILIDFFEQERKNHPMDPGFCAKKIDILSDKHILVLQHQDPSLVDSMIAKDPVSVVQKILQNDPNGVLSSTEIINILNRLMGEAKAKKWWTAAKKLLVKEPIIGVPAKKNGNYELREEPIKPEEEILEEFYLNKKPKTKILLAQKLYQLSSDVEVIANDLPGILQTLTEACKDSLQLTQSERLHGVWVRNDLARHLHEDPESMEPTSGSLIEETENLSELARQLPSTYLKRFLDLLTRVYPEKWQKIVFELLQDSDGRFTNECANFLIERDLTEDLKYNLTSWLLDQSIKGPVLFWMIKNRQAKKLSTLFEGMINPKLLSCVFSAIDHISLHSDSTRRIPLADLISDDVTLIPELLYNADEETATDLAQTLMINQGFDDLTKKSILARFIKRYPNIQSLIDGSLKTDEKESTLIVSKESYDKRRDELEELVSVRIPENKKAIEIAREHGDLRENAEYHMAKDDQKVLDARRRDLEKDLSRATVTDFSEAGTGEVGIGSVVELLEGSSGKILTFSILGAWDSAPEKNIVSYKTPLGTNLMSRKVNDEVEIDVDGVKEHWTIRSILRWVDHMSV